MLRYPHLAKRDLVHALQPWSAGMLIGGFLATTLAIAFSATGWTVAEAANLYLYLGLAGLLAASLKLGG